MIEKPVRQIHRHKTVWTHEIMDRLRKSDGLCLNCDNLEHEAGNGTKSHCKIAAQLLIICQQQDVALAVTRCPKWRAK